MGQFLPKPKTERYSTHGTTGNGLRYGLSSIQGWRKTIWDAHIALVGLPTKAGRDDWSFFAVYDGHASSRVADYCAGHMLDHILSTGVQNGAEQQPLKNCFNFLKIDGAVGVLLSSDHLYFINCGDSRAVLYQDGRVSFSTKDHKPYNKGEKERIRNGRVNGGRVVSRAYEYKCKRPTEQPMSPEPEVLELKRASGVEGKGPTEQPMSPEPEVLELKRASGEGDEFVVLACDGIWDVMTNEELGAFVRSRLQLWSDLETVCNAVVDTCLHKGSKDNISVVLVCFPGAPKVSKEAKRKEKKLDEFLETRVGELLKSGGVDGVPDLVTVVKSLATENIKNLPHGGGLDSKRSVIEAAYNKLNPHTKEQEAKESPQENGKADDSNPIQKDTIQ